MIFACSVFAKRFMENCKRDNDFLKISISLILWAPKVFSYSACGGLVRVDKRPTTRSMETLHDK